MKRRSFLRSGSLSGISVLLFSAEKAFSFSKNAISSSKPADSYEELTISQIQVLLEAKTLSSVELVKYYLQRIKDVDATQAGLNSVIQVNPEALKIASQLDAERKNGKKRGPLYGIPVLLKDNIDTADQLQTTAGSIAMEGNFAKTDAFVARQLRNAGAIILGKTNMSEWANFRSTNSSSGWSSRGGQTHNPYVLDRSPCGSSSGSAVAVAANLCAISVGTETNGSIACPASMNNVVGIKPTVGLVSRSGIIPISKTQDTAGPFGRTVADAALLLGAMVGIDPQDEVTKKSSGKSFTDYTRFLKADGLKGKRIGVEKTLLKKTEGVDKLLEQSLEQMKAQGATIIEVEFVNQKLGNAEGELLRFEFKDGLNKYLSGANGKVKTLEALIAFNIKNKEKAMPYFQQELLEQSQAKGDLDSDEYKTAYNKIITVRENLDKLFQEHQLDAVCGPATGPSWCIDKVNGDFWTGYGSYGPAAMAGYPSITVPMGLVNELPVGLSFLGKAYDEPGLISIGYAYEQFSKNRTKPKFIKSL